MEWGGSPRRTGGRRRTERRAGQGHPRMYFPYSLSLVRFYIFSGDESGGFLCLPFVFPTGGWGPDYDRLGRYWCQGKGHIYKQLLPLPWPFGLHVAG